MSQFRYLYNHINKRYLLMGDPFSPFIILRNFRKLESEETKVGLSNVKNCWTLLEHQSYIDFFREHSYFAHDKLLRKSKKMFKMMSRHIQTRDPKQIKSHHQKLMGKYGSLDNILAKLEKLTEGCKPIRKLGTAECQIEKSDSKIENLGSLEERSKRIEQQNLFELNLFDILTWPDHSSAEVYDYLQE